MRELFEDELSDKKQNISVIVENIPITAVTSQDKDLGIE